MTPTSHNEFATLRNHAQVKRYIHAELGFNYRMEGLQGLVLGLAARRNLACMYHERLSDLPLILPTVVNHDHVFHLYVIRSEVRDRLREYLLQHGIETGLHYPVPLHRQPCLAHFSGDPSSYPVAESYANECLSLPLFVGLSKAQLDCVCSTIRRFFGRT